MVPFHAVPFTAVLKIADPFVLAVQVRPPSVDVVIGLPPCPVATTRDVGNVIG